MPRAKFSVLVEVVGKYWSLLLIIISFFSLLGGLLIILLHNEVDKLTNISISTFLYVVTRTALIALLLLGPALAIGGGLWWFFVEKSQTYTYERAMIIGGFTAGILNVIPPAILFGVAPFMSGKPILSSIEGAIGWMLISIMIAGWISIPIGVAGGYIAMYFRRRSRWPDNNPVDSTG